MYPDLSRLPGNGIVRGTVAASTERANGRLPRSEAPGSPLVGARRRAPRGAGLFLAALALLPAAPAPAEDPSRTPSPEALTLVLQRRGSNPGDEQRAHLEPDGTLQVRAVRMVGSHREGTERRYQLPPRLLEGLRAEIERLRAFDLPPVPDPPDPDEATLVDLDLRLGERRLQRAYAFRHLYDDLPDLDLLRAIDLCTGLSLTLGDHLFEASRDWQRRGQAVYAVHFLRMSIQALEQALPPPPEGAVETPAERDRREAIDLEKKGEVKGAYERYERAFRHVREQIKSWFRARELLADAPFFSLTAPTERK